MPLPQVQIVTAAVIERDGRILIARRRPGGPEGGKWEFPGGKVEEGETPEACLRRELREELDLETRVEGFLCSSPIPHAARPLELFAYRVSLLSGDPVLRDHDRIAWVRPARLRDYEFAAADRAIVERLLGGDRDGQG